MLEIVAIDWADVIEAEFFEQRAAGGHTPGIFLCAFEPAPHAAAELLGDFRSHGAQAEIFARGHHPRQIRRKSADRRRDRHVVVIEDDDQAIARLFGIVHRLIGHARAHRAVADHGNAAPRPILHLVRHGEPQRRGNRGRAVRGPERVVFAFGTLGEATEAAALPQCPDPITAPGQNLVRVALVAHVPHQLVLRSVEDIVNRGGQFDHPQPRTEMPAGLPDGVDHFGTQFVGELAQLRFVQLAQIFGGIDRIKQRRFRAGTHNAALHRRIATVDERFGC